MFYQMKLNAGTLLKLPSSGMARKIAREIRRLPEINIGAIKAADPLHYCRVNPPFEIAKTHFYQAQGEAWRLQAGIDPELFPLIIGLPGGDIVPLAGGIYIGAKRLSDRILRGAGLRPATNLLGFKTRIPFMLEKNTRVIMWPSLHEFSFESKLLKSIAIQFKGAGGQYHGRVVFSNPGKWLSVKQGETLLASPGESKEQMGTRQWVGYPDLIGRFGIFLDSIHQPPPSTPDPVGAILVNDTRALETDALLLRNGAVLAAFSIGSIRIMKQEDIATKLGLSNYESGDLYVLCRVLLTDTRRLYALFDSEVYKYFIEDDYGLDFEQGRQQHLITLTNNMAKNIRAILLSRLAMMPKLHQETRLRPATFLNFDPCGAMFDTAELEFTDDTKLVEQTIVFWLDDICKVMTAAGLELPGDFLGSGLIENIFLTIFGQDYNLTSLRWKIHADIEFETPLMEIIHDLAKKIIEDWGKR